MKRGIVLGVLIGVGALSLAVAAQQPAAAPQGGGRGPDPNAPKIVEVDKIKDNLYMLKGGGGNTAAFITASGVVLVDTKNPGWGQPLLEKVKTLTDKPVTMLINTHMHGDHVSGNVEFPTTVDIVAHENTKKLMEEMRPVYGLGNPNAPPPPNIFKTNNGKGMPKRTFTDKMSIGSGNDKIDLYYFGPGHTGGDTWVVFPALRLAHMGDMFPNKNLPIIDINNGGSGVGFPQTLTKAAAGIQGVDTYIGGHNATTLTLNELKEYAEFNKDFMMWAEREMKAGKTVDQAAAEYTKHPDKYQGYAMPQPARVKANVQVYFDELKKGGATN